MQYFKYSHSFLQSPDLRVWFIYNILTPIVMTTIYQSLLKQKSVLQVKIIPNLLENLHIAYRFNDTPTWQVFLDVLVVKKVYWNTIAIRKLCKKLFKEICGNVPLIEEFHFYFHTMSIISQIVRWRIHYTCVPTSTHASESQTFLKDNAVFFMIKMTTDALIDPG